ncbi:hypothetical protein [Pseudocnuella soli]|uniref:hypothetical protein n=1 Tax=Pseudocnuella soli TaxID=2502779 RepID=UPI00104CB125|nr:hypothetical protein [Pseudocnuella soli]
MFQELHQYFFTYKTVGIPGVGTLQLVQQPAQLDVVNQQLLPPHHQVHFSRQAMVEEHQIQMLAYAYNNDTNLVAEELTRFGEALRSRLQEQPFSWQGIGRLELEGAYIQFEPQDANTAMLDPVAAQRVLRENVQHTVLVGDVERHMSTEEYQSELLEDAPRRSWVVLVGWIVAILSLLFIAYHIYIANSPTAASGLQQKVDIEQAPVQHN